MIVRKAIQGALFIIFMLAAASAPAVNSSLWEVDTKEDFDAGEPDDVSVWPPGQITLGPKASEVSLDSLYAWSLAEDSKANIYAGTGSDGKIFRISPEGKADLFADLELQQVLALEADKQKNVLYAGGFPGGKVYAINVKGEISEYFDTAQSSVWALSLGAGGTLFASTGDDGRIFSIQSGGKGHLLYDSPERRVLSLVCDREGNLYAGTEQNGLIYRFDASGRPFVLYDTELEEVTSMTLDDEGNLYAVSSPGELFAKIPPMAVPSFPKSSQESSHASSVAMTETVAQAPPLMPGMPVMPTPKKRACIIYKITKDGIASKFWTSPDKLVFSIALNRGNLLAGTGDDGVIYSISPTGEAATYYESGQKQVLDLYCAAGGSIVAALGNNAATLRFTGDYSEKGTFVSQVHDAIAQSRWGKLFWEAEIPPQTRLTFATRSGNSEAPDDTWSEWSKEHAERFDSDAPAARYTQWRATLSTSNPQETPTVLKVTTAYIQRNLPPNVKSVKVETGLEGQKEGSGAAPGGGDIAKALKALSSGGPLDMGEKDGGAEKATKEGVKTGPAAHETKLKIRWEAKDENEDTLEYELYFKGLEETRWKLIKDKLSVTSYEWDTQAIPDGPYHIRVVASDSPSNPDLSALTAQRVSESFIVDNTAPVAGPLKASPADSEERYRITATVSDNLSPIRSAQYSIDAGDWIPVFPLDGIFDSSSEKLELTTGKLEKGEHTVVLKVTDYFGNVGAGKTTFVVK